MLTVVGGCYYEFCQEPGWNQIYGSGLRAAAGLGALSDSVEFWTYCDNETLADLEALSATFGVECHHQLRPERIGFSYYHPFSTPRIFPSKIDQCENLRISATNVLSYGMLEGQAIVESERAVYDPQSPNRPRCFRENGSKSVHLAVLANAREGQILTGKTNLIEIGRALLASEEAEVVVLKSGPHGCTVFTSRQETTIPVFMTDYVWPIGSGDIFAAAFAHFWAECKFEPEEAARLGSIYAAYFCNSRSLPLPRNLEHFVPQPLILEAAELESSQVYLAGPFFSIPQRWMIEETRNILLGLGVRVFSPLHDVGRGSAEKVVPADIKGIEDSNVMLALLDGRDTGTIFEVGYAIKKDIPVVVLSENIGDEDLKMFAGTGCQLTNDLPTAIYKTVWSTKRK
jgi:Nucleoside 2-deoxyribosyltransferase/pfkB family carbohydrate kinase